MKYVLYTLDDIKENKMLQKNGILILDNRFFSLTLLKIVPSIDEDDRREMIYEKLSQEYFLDTEELQYLYYVLIQESAKYELIFCCYSTNISSLTVNLSTKIVCAIPECLLGMIISNFKKYYLVDCQEKEFLILFFDKHKILSFQKIPNNLDEEEIVESLSEINQNNLKMLLLGECVKNFKEILALYFSLYDIKDAIIKKIPKEIDVFHHSRLHNKKRYLRYLKYVYIICFFLIIFIGFYWQYQLENLRLSLVELEEEISKTEYELNVLEDKIIAARQEKEKKELELQENQDISIYKVYPMLWRIYQISKLRSLVYIESLENKNLKVQLKCNSQGEYLEFVMKALQKKFKIVNHDRIEKIGNKYEVEIEMIEENYEKETRS